MLTARSSRVFLLRRPHSTYSSFMNMNYYLHKTTNHRVRVLRDSMYLTTGTIASSAFGCGGMSPLLHSSRKQVIDVSLVFRRELPPFKQGSLLCRVAGSPCAPINFKTIMLLSSKPRFLMEIVGAHPSLGPSITYFSTLAPSSVVRFMFKTTVFTREGVKLL